ncbi:hypothetical protein A2317_02600 [Candidatus Uhrbacteria bacterium RIFOXYB2_FULL_41_10]|nr:MAG: hypothetical protein A2317_02600 [Candidatus Uhrbacteria bacterium RIFOXYB2_FULL_41_10]
MAINDQEAQTCSQIPRIEGGAVIVTVKPSPFRENYELRARQKRLFSLRVATAGEGEGDQERDEGEDLLHGVLLGQLRPGDVAEATVARILSPTKRLDNYQTLWSKNTLIHIIKNWLI